MKKSIRKLKIQDPEFYEEINDKTEEEMVLMKNSDLKEIAYTEGILLIDARSSSGKVVFSIIKLYK
jgi:hypothetical protein